ncbi:MAG: cytochrome b [Rhizomicrobium sp.]
MNHPIDDKGQSSRFADAVPRAALRYDNTTIWLHWTTVVLVAAQWLGAELVDFVPDKPMRHLYWSIHISLGATLALVVATHIWWRLTRGRQLPDVNSGIAGVVTRAVHKALNLLPVALVLLGAAIVLARGWNLFGVLPIPALPGSSRHVAHTIGEIHEWTAHVLVLLAGGHAIAALVHEHLLRDGVLQRIVPFPRR